MKRISIRLNDEVHAALSKELIEWQKLRGPRFSLNNLCEEKLSTPFPPTQWLTTTGSSATNTFLYTATCNTSPLSMAPQEKENKRARKRQ